MKRDEIRLAKLRRFALKRNVNMKQMNILFIFTDQQCASAMSCAGNGDLHTPAMDRLARGGVRFDRAYATQPLCTPARASLFTGRMPHTVGVTRNNQAIQERWRGQELGDVLGRAGYDCVYGGKWHVPEISLPEGHGFRPLAPFGDAGLAGACAAYLRDAPRRPFCLVASFDNPHNICEWARNQPLPWGPIPLPASVEDCPSLPPNFAPPSGEPEIIRIEQACNHRFYPTTGFSEAEWRQYRFAYYRLVEKVDAQIGLVLAALDEAGLTDSTLVVFSSDHGDGCGAHRWNQKSVLYEEVVRVPLIVSGPGVAAAGRTEAARLISCGLDLFPTFCDYAGAEAPAGLPGLSLRPLIEGRAPQDWRDEVVVETLFDGNRGYNTTGRMLRTDRWKYVVYSMGRNREALFDLQHDPGECENLAADPRGRDALADHRRRLALWCEREADPFSRLLVVGMN
jgi:arylsulfatase A-like enzyme